MSGWVCGLEGKEEIRGKGQGGSWEAKGCRGGKEEEEDVRVSPMTLRWGARGRGHPFGGGWRILDHEIQTQENYCQRQGGAMALQEG